MKKATVYKPKTTSNKKFAKKKLHSLASWTEYSIKFLSHNPTCYACGERARVVDHVFTARGDEEKFWNITNLIPLCKRCHDNVTSLFDRHLVPKTEEKMVWLSRKRVATDTSVRVKVVPRDF